MRSVFVFPDGERAATTAMLDRLFPGQSGYWTDEKLFIGLEQEQEQDGPLFTDRDPDDVRRLDSALGHHPTWALQVGVSGRTDGSAEVRTLLSHLLQAGGVVDDDYTEHCWTLQEIQHELKIDGLGFFDFRGHHARSHGQLLQRSCQVRWGLLRTPFARHACDHPASRLLLPPVRPQRPRVPWRHLLTGQADPHRQASNLPTNSDSRRQDHFKFREPLVEPERGPPLGLHSGAAEPDHLRDSGLEVVIADPSALHPAPGTPAGAAPGTPG